MQSNWPFALLGALALAWVLLNPPAAAAATDVPLASVGFAGPPCQPLLIAGFWNVIDAFFMKYREWILTMGLIVVILGFALLYKSWK